MTGRKAVVMTSGDLEMVAVALRLEAVTFDVAAASAAAAFWAGLLDREVVMESPAPLWYWVTRRRSGFASSRRRSSR